MSSELWIVGVCPDIGTVAVKSAVRCAGVKIDYMEERKQPFVVLGAYRDMESAEQDRDRLQEWYNATERGKAANEPLKARGGVCISDEEFNTLKWKEASARDLVGVTVHGVEPVTDGSVNVGVMLYGERDGKPVVMSVESLTEADIFGSLPAGSHSVIEIESAALRGHRRKRRGK